jgi:Uma2 family endonuclease
MVVATARKKDWTDEALFALPDDGKRYEIIDGEMLELPSPSYLHQVVSSELHALLHQFVRSRQLGRVTAAPQDVRLSDSNVVQPDLVFLSNEKIHFVRRGRINGAPDLVVEILSPSTAGVDLVRKLWLYMKFGIREYWVVEPDTRSIVVYELEENRYVTIPQANGIVRSRVLDGLEFDPLERLPDPTLFIDGEEVSDDQ